MGYFRETALPASEPVALADAKSYLRLDAGFTAHDTIITNLIRAAREHAEKMTGRCLAQRTFRAVLDSFPYYTDTIQSQLAYPPSYYSLPRYSSTLWNYSQMIKLGPAPIISVQAMRYVDPDGFAQTLNQDTDFTLDRITEPARIFPKVSTYWPANLYVCNALEIDYTAGYTSNLNQAPDTHSVDFAPSCSITDETGDGAQIEPVIQNGQVAGYLVLAGGANYVNPQLAVTAAAGSGATGTPVVVDGVIVAVAPGAPGSGYLTPPPMQQPDSIIVPALPATIWRCVMMLIAAWYDNPRMEPDPRIDSMLLNESVVDFQPTRG